LDSNNVLLNLPLNLKLINVLKEEIATEMVQKMLWGNSENFDRQ